MRQTRKKDTSQGERERELESLFDHKEYAFWETFDARKLKDTQKAKGR